jgi:uncharacterized protein (DUF736 family)
MAVQEAARCCLEYEKENIMATIGTFKKDGAGYTGSIETLTLTAKITIDPASKMSDKAPDFRVFHIGNDFTSEIGAAWKKASREGAEYLSALRANISETLLVA